MGILFLSTFLAATTFKSMILAVLWRSWATLNRTPQEIDLQRESLAWHRANMPKRHKQKRPTDVNQLAHHLVELSTESTPLSIPLNISEYMSEIGRKGGKIGGKRRLKTMTAAERKKVAAKAARARWKKSK
jgi:hypothetical protein